MARKILVVDAILAGITFCLVLMSVWLIGPWIETRFFPVVGELEIVRSESVDELRTRVWVRFRKYRECPPIDVYWYRGTRETLFGRVVFTVEQPVGGNKFVNRPIGYQHSGPWVVGVPQSELKAGAFSDAQHNCWPLWPTISRFYN